MFTCMNNPYDKLSINIAGLLKNFSYQTMIIEDCIKTLLTYPQFNTSPDFMKFVFFFDKGKYYHYQCEGYMKCLIITKCYSPISISYWLNELVYPAASFFSKSLTYLDSVKEVDEIKNHSNYKNLNDSIELFKSISNEIMECTEMYNL